LPGHKVTFVPFRPPNSGASRSAKTARAKHYEPLFLSFVILRALDGFRFMLCGFLLADRARLLSER